MSKRYQIFKSNYDMVINQSNKQFTMELNHLSDIDLSEILIKTEFPLADI